MTPIILVSRVPEGQGIVAEFLRDAGQAAQLTNPSGTRQLAIKRRLGEHWRFHSDGFI